MRRPTTGIAPVPQPANAAPLVGDSSPWGAIDRCTRIADGIHFVSTPSHGGFRLSPARLARFPLAVLGQTWRALGRDGWFEEDCDAYLIPVAFPDCFSKEEQARAYPGYCAWLRHHPDVALDLKSALMQGA
jgi:hypothetical protein